MQIFYSPNHIIGEIDNLYLTTSMLYMVLLVMYSSNEMWIASIMIRKSMNSLKNVLLQ